jgi:hypothetical protein
MEQETNINNKVFLYAFAGALLLSAAIFLVMSMPLILPGLELPYLPIALVVGAISLPLLFKAVKHDTRRLKQLNRA